MIPLCLTLSNIRYVSRVKWSNPGKGSYPHLHLGVVAIEKGAFWSPLTTVTNYIYIYIYIYICMPMPPIACSRLCSRDSALVVAFARSAENIALFKNTPIQAKSLLHSLEQTARGTWSLEQTARGNGKHSGIHVFQSRRSHLHSKWRFSEFSRQDHVPRQQRLNY